LYASFYRIMMRSRMRFSNSTGRSKLHQGCSPPLLKIEKRGFMATSYTKCVIPPVQRSITYFYDARFIGRLSAVSHETDGNVFARVPFSFILQPLLSTRLIVPPLNSYCRTPSREFTLFRTINRSSRAQIVAGRGRGEGSKAFAA
jgi:hypothetical protein